MPDVPGLPQGLLDQLIVTLGAKSAADGALGAKAQTAATLQQASADDQAKATDLEAKTTTLGLERAKLEALEDAYFQVGASPPAPPTPPPVTPPPPVEP